MVSKWAIYFEKSKIAQKKPLKCPKKAPKWVSKWAIF